MPSRKENHLHCIEEAAHIAIKEAAKNRGGIQLLEISLQQSFLLSGADPDRLTRLAEVGQIFKKKVGSNLS